MIMMRPWQLFCGLLLCLTVLTETLQGEAGWRDARVDLTQFAGRSIGITLKVSGDPGNVGPPVSCDNPTLETVDIPLATLTLAAVYVTLRLTAAGTPVTAARRR